MTPRRFYLALAMLWICGAGTGALILHAIQPDVAQAFEREIGR